ncbi:hypothetical protein KY289_017541 [Solanum tuberosum]|nr:hypothetical protein KY289_017541 [Solanum tuberosum]
MAGKDERLAHPTGFAQGTRRQIQKPESMKLGDWVEIDEKAASAIKLHLTDDVTNNAASKPWSNDRGESKVIVLLNSLPSFYDNLATTILHGKDSIELNDVTSDLLLNEKMRKKPENHGQALITESRGKSYQRSSSNYGRSGARGKSKKQMRKQRQKNDDNTTAMVQNNDNVVLLINKEEECMHLAGVESEWVVDTTVSYHATLMNLISGVTLDRDGYENYFANKKLRLTKGGLVIEKGVARGTLYRTNAEICQGELNAAHEEILQICGIEEWVI